MKAEVWRGGKDKLEKERSREEECNIIATFFLVRKKNFDLKN